MKTRNTVILFILLIVSFIGSKNAFPNQGGYITIPYFTENKIRFYRISTTNLVGELDLNQEFANFTIPFYSPGIGPNATAIWSDKIFISFDNTAGQGGVLIYNYADLFPVRTGNPPIIISGAPAAGIAIHPNTGDLYVSKFFSGGTTGKITRYTQSTNWSQGSAFDLPVPNWWVNYYSGISFLSNGTNIDLCSFSLDDHTMIYYTESSNYDNFYVINNGTTTNLYPAATLTGGTVNVHLFSGPEGLASDVNGNLWFANNNDWTSTNNPGDGTFGKINPAYFTYLKTQAISGNSQNPTVSNSYTIPQGSVNVYYLLNAKFGGMGNYWDNRMFINDQGNYKIWKWDSLSSPYNSTHFKQFGTINATYPGFGGLALNSYPFALSGGLWTHLTSGIINNNTNSFTGIGTTLFTGTFGGGVFRTSNYGLNWVGVNNGLTNTNINFLASGGNNIYAGSQAGVFTSTNNGNNWTLGTTGMTNLNVTSLAVSGSIINAGTFGGGVFRSTNNGSSWTAINGGLTNQTVSSLAVNGNNLYAGTTGGVFYSSNSGNNWSSINNNLADLNIRTLLVNGTTIFAGTTTGGVFRSTNNGGSWSQINNGLPSGIAINTFSVSGANLFVGTQSGIFLSTDNGQTWIDKNQGFTTNPIDYTLFITNNYIFAGTNDNVYRRQFSEVIGVKNISASTPKNYLLYQNYPNPFNPVTKISFDIVKSGFVTLGVYDILGREVKTLVNEMKQPGSYVVSFNGSEFSSGVYFYKLLTNKFTDVKKMMLIK